MILSILIPATYDRQITLNLLLQTLRNQIKQTKGKVQILGDIDNYQRTVGEKRNLLIQSAKGEYLSFIDSDDMVSDNYISLVLKGIETKPDCISLNGILSEKGKADKLFRHSKDYTGWYERNNILYRGINHLNPIKTSIARQIRYPLVNRGEDKAWSLALEKSRLLKKEYKIEQVIYFYDYIKKPFSK